MTDEMSDNLAHTPPPRDVEAERAVLGGMLLSQDAITEVVEVLRTADFWRPAHQILFDTILDLHGRSKPADAIATADELTERGEIRRVGGRPYLHTLISEAPCPSKAVHHAKIVKRCAVLRRIIETGTRIVQMGYAADGPDPNEILDAAQAELFDLADTIAAEQNDSAALCERMPGVLDEIEAVGSRDGRMVGVPTGFDELDALIGGLRRGLVHTVFGAAGIGCSTFALDLARAAAIKHGLTTVIFSGQSPANEVTIRMLSAEARVALFAIRMGAMQDEDWTRLARRMQEVVDAPLFIEDDPGIAFAELRAECRRLKRRHDLKLIVIDGVNLYARPTAPESLWAAQARLSADIKRLAAELRIPIVITVPSNRRADNRIDRRPSLPDIASSSAYAADADIIIGLHRDDAYEKESPRAGEADLIILSNRYGPTATVTVAFQGHYSRFVSMVK